MNEQQLLAELYVHALHSMVDPETLTTDWGPMPPVDRIVYEHQNRLKELLDLYGSGTVGS